MIVITQPSISEERIGEIVSHIEAAGVQAHVSRGCGSYCHWHHWQGGADAGGASAADEGRGERHQNFEVV